ncbi:MAG: DNA/RNA non-specific endonuclease [Methylovulum sp.]|nr:DNA/RNA non-specific endonuclease [Methylovulum sp.]MCF7997995.1 DNA/RNA non-specific endonuclease [Methylovulum sp.]
MGRRARSFWLKLLFGVCRLVWRHPKPFLLLLMLGAGDYAYELKIARPNLLYQGAPQASRHVTSWFRIFRNHGFILGYSDLRGNPLWVEYRLSPVSDNTQSLKRPSRFSTDWRGINRVSHNSYQNSGYDRGHLAPNYAISHLYGKSGQADSFLMTNISPQKPNLNQKLWQRLEEVEINYFAKTFGKVWVITGPVFTGSTERLNSDWLVEIPDAFYKIYLTESTPVAKPLALAFLVPQTVTGKEPLTQFVTTIDTIEAQTGLDFIADLEDATESVLEASNDTQAWHLQSVSRLPSRY